MSETTSNRAAADVLFNVATILELSEGSPYRIRAYRRAARLLMRGDPITAEQLQGLGPKLRDRLVELSQQSAR